MHEIYLSLEGADNEQINFATELKNLDKGTKTTEKKKKMISFFLALFFSAREKFLMTLTADY